jgi:hypothetical protein
MPSADAANAANAAAVIPPALAGDPGANTPVPPVPDLSAAAAVSAVLSAVETERAAKIAKINATADRKRLAAMQATLKLPARKTNAFEFMELQRAKIRQATGEQFLPDKACDAVILSGITAWLEQKYPTPAAV